MLTNIALTIFKVFWLFSRNKRGAKRGTSLDSPALFCFTVWFAAAIWVGQWSAKFVEIQIVRLLFIVCADYFRKPCRIPNRKLSDLR